MAKSRRRSKGRVTNVNANRRLPLSISPLRLSPLTLYEDRRLFHPDPLPAARSFNKLNHSLVLRDRTYTARSNTFNRSTGRSQTKAAISFENPDRVLVCVRRGIRKEVLHALRKTGKVGQKRPRRSVFSDVHC